MQGKERLRVIALDEVANYAQAFGNHIAESEAGKRLNKGRAALKRRIKKRARAELSEVYGFFTVEWLLLTVLSGLISWAIRRWLDNRFKQNT